MFKIISRQLKISQAETILWHATTPRLFEQINGGPLVPSRQLEEETGEDFSGWGFKQQGHEYGSGVYLATSSEWALYYADIRLKREREDWEDAMDLFDENTEYIALYKVHIIDTSKLVPVYDEFRRPGQGEYMYLGKIYPQPNTGVGAWYDFVRWVARTRDAERYRNHIERVYGPIEPTPESETD